MADLTKIKRKLKKWESAFFTVHQRKPEKDDVSSAPGNIKALYRTYHAARHATTSHSISKQESTGKEKRKKADKAASSSARTESPQLASVWGAEFNRKPSRNSVPHAVGIKCSGATKWGSSLLNKLGDKLAARCSTPPPPLILAPKTKPFSTLRMKSPETRMSSEALTELSEIGTPKSESISHTFEISSSLHTHKTTANCATTSEEEFRVRGAVFERAMKLSTGKKRGGMDEAAVSKKFLLQLRPGRQFAANKNVQDLQILESGSLSQSLDHNSLAASARGWPENGVIDGNDETGLQPQSSGDDMAVQKRDENRLIVSSPSANHSPCVSVSQVQPSISGHTSRSASASVSRVLCSPNTETDIHPSSPDVGQTKHRISYRSEMRTDSQKPRSDGYYGSEEGIAGPSTVSMHVNYSSLINRSGQAASRKTACLSLPAEEEGKGDICQGSLKGKRSRKTDCSQQGDSTKGKRSKTTDAAKRKRHCTDDGDGADHWMDIDEVDSGAQEPVSPVRPAKKKRTAGSSTSLSASRKTDNFVRLNMKAKKFVKKGSHLTGAQWKRKQWKQKMAARSKSYGDKCFMCGQSGHWANKCPGNDVASRIIMEGEVILVDEQAFPSLRSAALMAQGIRAEGDPQDMVFGGDEELAVEAMVVRERYEPQVCHIPVSPFSHLVPDVEGEVQKGLKKFGFCSFKQGQKETITRILNGESTLVVLSTGGGKSLCYQLPAYLYAQRTLGITLVVSPLVSLMEDQVTGLPPGVQGACLNSSMTPGQRDSVLADVSAGKVHFLLVSPEAVVGGGRGGQGSFPSVDKLPPIFFACIDEVHCLSEWSHNFRPSYLRLCKVLREQYGVSCFLGLTATATRQTAADVRRHLGIADWEEATIRGSPVPPNLCLSVSRDENRDEALVNLLQGKRFSSCSSIIIYCTRREQVERVATLIRTCLLNTDAANHGLKKRSKTSKPQTSWTVESYHAGLTPAQRKSVQRGFMEGRVRIVVATVAFGMGLDKADVRAVVHYNLPKSFENYVQEIGRAGRDGQTSHCHLFLDPQNSDLTELQRHTFGNSVDRLTVKKLLQRLFIACRCRQVIALQAAGQQTTDGHTETSEAEVSSAAENKGHCQRVSLPEEQSHRVCPGHERAFVIQQLVNDLDIREENIETLLCYLELHVPRLVTCLSPVYATCRVQCYGGPAQLQALAHKCPPVAVAIAKQKLLGKTFSDSNSVEFPVVDLSDSMGWDSGPVKRELRALQWTVRDREARKSGVIVTFSDLAFHVRACGDISDEERDGLVDFLHGRTVRQERSQLAQLSLLAQRLRDVSHKNYWMCADEVDLSRSERLKKHLDEHFHNVDSDDDHGTTECATSDEAKEEEVEVDPSALTQLVSDIRKFAQLYGGEHSLTGRAVARVFHGIDSPRFPAATWGRVRRFWRCQLHLPFPVVLREATRQLLLLR